MSDILERLRLKEIKGTSTLMDLAAADEIARLRDVLTWTNDNCPGKCGAVAGATLRDEMAKVCEWTPDGDQDWTTGCDKHFEFSDGGLADNGFEFCPFCGGPINLLNEADS